MCVTYGKMVNDVSAPLISILLVTQLQTQHLMTSQIWLHIEYLIQTCNVMFLILFMKIDEKNLVSLIYTI